MEFRVSAATGPDLLRRALTCGMLHHLTVPKSKNLFIGTHLVILLPNLVP